MTNNEKNIFLKLEGKPFNEVFPEIDKINKDFSTNLNSIKSAMDTFSEQIILQKIHNGEHNLFGSEVISKVIDLSNYLAQINALEENKQTTRSIEDCKEFLFMLRGVQPENIRLHRDRLKSDPYVVIHNMNITNETLSITLIKRTAAILAPRANQKALVSVSQREDIKRTFNFPSLWFTNEEKLRIELQENRQAMNEAQRKRAKKDEQLEKLRAKVDRKLNYIYKSDENQIITLKKGTLFDVGNTFANDTKGLDYARLNYLYYPYDAILTLLNLKKEMGEPLYVEEIKENFMKPLSKLLKNNNDLVPLDVTEFAIYQNHKSVFKTLIKRYSVAS